MFVSRTEGDPQAVGSAVLRTFGEGQRSKKQDHGDACVTAARRVMVVCIGGNP